MPFGDFVEDALERVGITSEVVEGWLGKDCGCRERRDRLNAIDNWARRVVAGRVEGAIEYLRRLLGN